MPSHGIGSLPKRAFVATFAILLCALGIYIAVAPVWSDWNSAKKSAAEYDLAMADLQSAVKGAITIDWSTAQPIGGENGQNAGAKPKKQGRYTVADIAPTQNVMIPDSARDWIRPERRDTQDASSAASLS